MEFETVIGLEVHVELLTKTKIFCACRNAFGGEANTRVCPVCTGQPGSLPVLNRRVVELAVLTGLAFNSDITERTRFDRKNYFYPDNPQNYQISQLYAPLCTGGYLKVNVGSGEKKIRIHEMHMEEDAGKLIHSEDGDETIVDLNRAGVPLIEIVTEPDMRNADEVIAFLEMLRYRILYLGASDCRLNEGSMRVDVNLSLREKGRETLGTRTEMKNLNSFRAIRHAIAGEAKRQGEILMNGGKVIMETRRWDEGKDTSFSMRGKEEAKDYRYFPEPDLLPLVLEKSWIEELRQSLPEFREERAVRLQKDYGIPEKDALVITGTKQMADLFEETARLSGNPKKAANWLLGDTLRLMREKEMGGEGPAFSPENLAKLIKLTELGMINSTVATEIFEVMFEEDTDPEKYAEEKGLLKIEDRAALDKAVGEVIEENPGPVKQYLEGKEKVMGFLVGQLMKKTGGRADPKEAGELLAEKIRTQL